MSTNSIQTPEQRALQTRLHKSMQALLNAFITHYTGSLFSAPPTFPPPTSLSNLATSLLHLLFHLLASTYRSILAHELTLFPGAHLAPAAQLNMFFVQASYYIDEDERWKRPRKKELGMEVKRVLGLIDDCKRRCREYRRAWELLRMLMGIVSAASEGGTALGVDEELREVWFWEEMERVTGVDGLEGMGEWECVEEIVGWAEEGGE